jgi:hypothetical protein
MPLGGPEGPSSLGLEHSGQRLSPGRSIRPQEGTQSRHNSCCNAPEIKPTGSLIQYSPPFVELPSPGNENSYPIETQCQNPDPEELQLLSNRARTSCYVNSNPFSSSQSSPVARTL